MSMSTRYVTPFALVVEPWGDTLVESVGVAVGALTVETTVAGTTVAVATSVVVSDAAVACRTGAALDRLPLGADVLAHALTSMAAATVRINAQCL